MCDHPHIFDMIRHITGSDFEWVYSEVAPNIRPDIEEEDMLSVIGKMKDGTIFSLDPSWSKMEERLKVPAPGWEVFPKRMEVNITINGEKGTIMTDCLAQMFIIMVVLMIDTRFSIHILMSGLA